jgi:membrane-associated protein
MEPLVTEFLRLFTHTYEVLNGWMVALGPWLYVILFAIIFCETGLVVTPFLPGDSLLFAIGALAVGEGSPLSLALLLPLLIVAAVVGDAVNYWAGHLIGPRVFQRESSWLLNKKHLLKAQAFYARHGGKTIVLARFVPIVRTFAPFVAGVGRMGYARFWAFNVLGGILWVTAFLVVGAVFGNQPIVKSNFKFVILGIVFISVLPIAVEWWLSRRRGRHDEGAPPSAGVPVTEAMRESA